MGARTEVGPTEAEVEGFKTFLKGKGLKLTEQRAIVLERALSSQKQHFSAEELFEDLRKRGISKATVYRTLALLVAANILDAVDLLDRGYKLYERAGGHDHHHDHLICMKCRTIVEFHDDRIERAQGDVADKHDFQIVHHTHKIYGVCSACRGNEDEQRLGRKKNVRS